MLLPIHPTKSCFLAFGSKGKIKQAVKKEMENRPLVYDNFTIKSKTEEKWLGDILSDRGLDKSVKEQ